MTNCTKSREKWRREFEAALAVFADSVTGRVYGTGQTLRNADFRILMKNAQSGQRFPTVLDGVLTDINADTIEIINLITSHPSVGAIFDGNGADAVTHALMPWKGFPLSLRDLAKHALVLAIRRDEHSAAADIDEFLFKSTGGRLSGFEVAVIQGVATSGVMDLGPGTRLTSYGEAIKLGLLCEERGTQLQLDQDFREREASIIFREFTWSPCLIAPNDHKHPLNPDGKVDHVEPAFV